MEFVSYDDNDVVDSMEDLVVIFWVWVFVLVKGFRGWEYKVILERVRVKLDCVKEIKYLLKRKLENFFSGYVDVEF